MRLEQPEVLEIQEVVPLARGEPPPGRPERHMPFRAPGPVVVAAAESTPQILTVTGVSVGSRMVFLGWQPGPPEPPLVGTVAPVLDRPPDIRPGEEVAAVAPVTTTASAAPAVPVAYTALAAAGAARPSIPLPPARAAMARTV